jgi:hypothetical protein
MSLKKENLSWLSTKIEQKWIQWNQDIISWLGTNATSNTRKDMRLAMKFFFGDYLSNYAVDKSLFFENKDKQTSCGQELFTKLTSKYTLSTANKYYHYICNFIDYVIDREDIEGRHGLKNPIDRLAKKNDGRYRTDPEMMWVTKTLGQEWDTWRFLAASWLKDIDESITHRRSALSIFFEHYLNKNARYAVDINKFLFGIGKQKISTEVFVSALKGEKLSDNKAKITNNYIFDFVDYILVNHSNRILLDDKKHSTIVNPLTRLSKKVRRNKSDTNFVWLVQEQGENWEQWQSFAKEWMSTQTTGNGSKINGLNHFFSTYLFATVPYAFDVRLFFSGKNGHKCSSENMAEVFKKRDIKHNTLASYINAICEFLNFVIEKHFSITNEYGVSTPIVSCDFSKSKKNVSHSETVRNPMPYTYIEEAREILTSSFKCSKPIPYDQLNVCDLLWAQSKNRNDWFQVEYELIDENDPDCVWRRREIRVNDKKKSVIYEIWSPVRALALLVKLHLPLRTYQVRMLDSGEADTWRYTKGKWQLNNKHGFVYGDEKRPYGKGVFKRTIDTLLGEQSTGLYVNTNKTADQNKDEFERGYVIPWQHGELLYWLEKLRNWQEKYNPISYPTSAQNLENKHAGVKTKVQKAFMGELCFLFRDPTAANKALPTTASGINYLWFEVLAELEDRLYRRGETLDNNQRLELVCRHEKGQRTSGNKQTHFPLHSLRVSLITAYTMDTELPLPVISKLLAGHSRLFMTIYYNKITPSVMAEKMSEAEGQLKDKSQQSVRNFLKDASLSQIQCKMVYHKEDSIQAALVNRNPIGWEERSSGLCLVGGNTVKSDEISTLGGCWNGGELIKDASSAANRIYGSVPHGPENCIRCRWFITEARYLPALNAQFNQLSYKAHQAANLSVEIEGELEALKDEQFFCEEQGAPFTKHNEMQVLQRRYEKQQVEADEYAKDWIACFELINKIIRVEENRKDDDSKDKLITVGGEQDISHVLKFVETESELLHLSLLCDDAEFYPDLQDELRKTPAIEKRSRQLSSVMMKKGFEPIFMEMDDKQQLIAANAMLRQMAKIADPDDKMEGYRKVANYIEAGEYLSDNKLFSEGMNALSDRALRLESFTQPALLEK